MTQSGQGDEPQLPAARPAHEGVVLPADGGEPLIPGTHGEQAVPAGGAPWGQPWGPEAPQAAPSYGQGEHFAPGQAWSQDQQQPLLPQPPQYAPQNQQSYGQDPAYGRPQPYGQLEPEPYAQPQLYGQPAQDPGFQPPQPPGFDQQMQQPQGLPPLGAPPPQPPSGNALPQPQQGGALPPADGAATQYLPPVPQAGQYPGPPPQAAHSARHDQNGPLPGALPPEVPAADATQFLGRQSLPSTGGNPDAEATQYIAPVPPAPATAPYGIRPGAPGDRQPPAEFDNLFRSAPATGGSDSTQQMPQFRDAPAQPQQQFAGPPEPPSRRTGSKLPVFVAVGVAIAVLGVGAGALLAGGGDDEVKDKPKNVVDATSASPEASQAVDPAEQQAAALDKLLGESNDSRDAVINSVRSIDRCRNLGKAATDLRGAAKQRGDLMARLAQLKVDELPKNAELIAALNKAWKSSASADNHYAAWADQVAAKKGCPKGKPRPSGHRAAAVNASGVATKAKEQAASLWNAIAGRYSLTKRSAIQL